MLNLIIWENFYITEKDENLQPGILLYQKYLKYSEVT